MASQDAHLPLVGPDRRRAPAGSDQRECCGRYPPPLPLRQPETHPSVCAQPWEMKGTWAKWDMGLNTRLSARALGGESLSKVLGGVRVDYAQSRDSPDLRLVMFCERLWPHCRRLRTTQTSGQLILFRWSVCPGLMIPSWGPCGAIIGEATGPTFGRSILTPPPRLGFTLGGRFPIRIGR